MALATAVTFGLTPRMLLSFRTVTTPKNQLYYGDNYEVLQRYIKDETFDLVYLDPPFNSRLWTQAGAELLTALNEL